MRALVVFLCAALCPALIFGQNDDATGRFEFADIHVSPKVQNPFMRSAPPRGDRFEVRNATMLDLIRTAYTFDADKVLGGPNWLEMDRYDIVAKVPPGVVPETRRLMQQALLTDRFKLVVHKDTKAMPAWALVAGKKLQLKEATGEENTGCHVPPAAAGPSPEGSGITRMTMMTGNGPPTTFSLGPGMTVQFQCRNMTMAAFADGLRGMFGVGQVLGNNPVRDETGVKGAWNFDVKWSMQVFSPAVSAGDRISVFDALEKQLGLKLEERQVPTPVLLVDSVDQKPSENPPGTAEALPPVPLPTEFEVAEIKPADPSSHMMSSRFQPGGRYTVQGMPMRFLLGMAFGTGMGNNDAIVGAPKWADTDRFDITAKAPASVAQLDQDTAAPMVHALLADRFKLVYHKDERPLPAYALVAVKPKMKKADPASRTYCHNDPPPPSAPPGSRVLTCQNIAMSEFAERLQNMGPGLNWPVLDDTSLEGRWDFTLMFSQNFMVTGARGGDGGPGGPGALPDAADPSGAITIFQAVEKQLGLKLESRKRSMPVFVIDHIEQKPTEN